MLQSILRTFWYAILVLYGKIAAYAKRSPRSFGIICFVVTAHIAFLASALVPAKAATSSPIHKPLIVRSVVYEPPPKPAVVPVKPKKVKKKAPEKKVEEKKPKKKAKKDETKKVVDKERQQKLQDIRSALADIGKGQMKIEKSSYSRNLTVPQVMMDTPYVRDSQQANTATARYKAIVIELLQLHLQLPEQGAVKLSMNISRSGAVAMIEVAEEGDRKNRDYVKKYLPAIAFPPFGEAFPNQDECSFAITLVGGA